MIRTTSRRPRGHYRAGVFHSQKGSEWPDGRFTGEQLKQLKADPFLAVEKREGEPAPTDSERAGKALGGALADDLAAERERLADLERSLAARKDALDGADAAMTARQNAIDEMLGNEAFRAVALRYGVLRVLAGVDAKDFTKGGAPTTEAISREALGLPCSAQERDALVAEMSPPK
jgi:hypothetical protein